MNEKEHNLFLNTRSNYRWWKCSRVKKNDLTKVLETYGVRCKNETLVHEAIHGRFFLKKDEQWVIERDIAREEKEDKLMTTYQQSGGDIQA